MYKILFKRTLREIKSNALRYIALCLLVVATMFLVVSTIGAAESYIHTVEETARETNLEDGEFGTFVPLTRAELLALEEAGAQLEEMPYTEYGLSDSSVLRVMKTREKINLLHMISGRPAVGTGEIALEKTYAAAHSLVPGDTIEVAGRVLTVSGIAITEDYDMCVRQVTDTATDAEFFGTAFVTAELYKELLDSGRALQSESIRYAYKLHNGLTHDKLKAALNAVTVDVDSIEDVYFRETVDGALKDKREAEDAVNGLRSSAAELNGALNGVRDGVRELDKGILTFKGALGSLAGASELIAQLAEGFRPVVDGSGKLNGGAEELVEAGGKFMDAADELKRKTDELLGARFKTEIPNLTDFMPAGNNPRIMASVEDSSSDLSMGILTGIIVLIVVVYVISVFVVHSIEQDAPVIGTLYALGITPGKLRAHYVLLPVLICLAGGAAGTAAGFSEFGFGLMGGGAATYFSMPELQIYYAPYILVYGLLMPPLVALSVNLLILRKKLNRPALSLMRREAAEKHSDARAPKTKSFVRVFRRRQLLREKRSTVAILAGILISLLVLALGFNTLYFCDNLKNNTLRDTSFEYMYLYKYPAPAPEGGYEAYVESLGHGAPGASTDVTVIGLAGGNPFFPEITAASTDALSISGAAQSKFGLRTGDEFTLTDEVNDRIYGFRVHETVDYDSGLYVFMDIDSMRELFGRDEDYCNAVFSDRELDIDAGRLYSVTTRADIVNSAEVFSELMQSSCTAMIIVAIIVFLVVLYQMLRVMIDRSATPISLMKIFGYNDRLIRKLYLDGNFVIVAVISPFLILLSKWFMDMIFPSFLISACGNDFTWPLWLYFAIYGGVIALYLVIRQLLMRSLNRITPALVLKNRE